MTAACAPDGGSGVCTCERGNTAQECALLGSAVGTQDAAVAACHVITCAHLALEDLAGNMPATATKVDLQNLLLTYVGIYCGTEGEGG